MTRLTGACHCGAITVELTTAHADDLVVRACQCGFCRRHGARNVSDPDGHLTLSFSNAGTERYRFGHGETEFLVCKACGTYVAAVMAPVATLNVVGADMAAFAGRPGEPMVYDAETPETRRERRLERWTPVTLEVRP